MNDHPRISVLGTPISGVTKRDVIEYLTKQPTQERATVVAICNVHSVMSARRDLELASVLDSADLATPDGAPIAFALRWMGLRSQERIPGPDVMEEMLLGFQAPEVRHFLFGSTPTTLEAIKDRVRRENPSAQIVGAISPPFDAHSNALDDEHSRQILRSGANIVWVGLGMPKQELWMGRMRDRLPGVALVGVGAAFDFLAGAQRRAPQWVQRIGMEWLYRLSREPRRLWRRYAINNPAFVLLLSAQLVAARFGRRPDRH